jgi:DNA-directed RNA polymerase beta subunit/intein/homing endonuclease
MRTLVRTQVNHPRRMSSRRSKTKPAATLRRVLDAIPDAPTDEDVADLAEGLQEVDEDRREAAGCGIGEKGKGRVQKGKERVEEAEEEDDAVVEAGVAVEEAPNHVELPRGLFPDVDANLEADRRRAEADIEERREAINRREDALLSAPTELKSKILKVARAYYAVHAPSTPIIDDYNHNLDIMMHAASEFYVETPLGVEPRQRVSFVEIDDNPNSPGIRLEQPTRENGEPLYPSYCRVKKLSYLLTQRARCREEVENVSTGEYEETVDKTDIEVAKLPLMVGSKACYLDVDKVPREQRPDFDEDPNDPYGYFIILGKMRSLTGQEKLSIDLSILINRGVKKGTATGFECQMLCMTPSKALSHHLFFEAEVAKKGGQLEIMAYVQGLTPVKAANAIELLRALKIVEQVHYDEGTDYIPSDVAVRAALDSHIEELCKGASSETLARNFKVYLSTTLDKALEERDDVKFLDQFASKHSGIPLYGVASVARPVVAPKKKPKAPVVKMGRRQLEAAAEEASREQEPVPVPRSTTPDHLAVWRYVMDRLFPQVTRDSYKSQFRATRPDLSARLEAGGQEAEDAELELDALAYRSMQRAKEYLLIYNVFRLFLYRESPGTETDDRDHFGIKRVELAGSLMANLYLKELQKAKRSIEASFADAWRKEGHSRLLTHVKRFFETSKLAGAMKPSGAPKHKAQNITAAMYLSFTSESWGSSPKYSTAKGVSHVLEHESLASMISGVRRVSSKGDQAQRTITPHLFHPSQDNLFCPFETSDDVLCLDADEEVLLESGEYRRIGDVREGDRVAIVDLIRGKVESSAVYNCFEREMKPKEVLYELATLSGRKMRVTDDHPMLTQRGRVGAKDLVDGDKLVVVPHLEPASREVPRVLVLGEDGFLARMMALGVHRKLASFHAEGLRKRGLLPLYSDDVRLPVIARMYGFTLGDGTVGLTPEKVKYKGFTNAGAVWYKAETSDRAGESTLRPYSGFCFGTEEDGLAFEADMMKVGLETATPKLRKGEIVDRETGRVSVQTTWKVGHGSFFPSLLMALGMNPGKKTDVETAPIPEWTMRGSRLVQREFLAGLMGADGSKIAMYGVKDTLSVHGISQQRRPDMAQGLVTFYEQMKELLGHFGVETGPVQVKDAPHATDRRWIHLPFSVTVQNAMRYVERVGYRYAATKRRSSEDTCEYLRYKTYATALHRDMCTQVHAERDAGRSASQIGRRLDITTASVAEYVSCRVKSNPERMWTYQEWLRRVDRVSDVLYVPFLTRVVIPRCRVSCFTTHSDHHNLVTKRAVGCGNCGIRKYLAITAEVSREYASDALLERFYARIAARGITLFSPEEWRDTLEEPGRYWPIYTNGIPIGYASEEILDVVREWRRTAGAVSDNLDKAIPDMALATISAYVKCRLIPGMIAQRELHVSSTPNRMVRPLFIVSPIDPSRPLSYDNQALLIDLESARLGRDLWSATWDELVWKYHVVEFLDKREEEMYSQTTAHFPWELSNGKGITYMHCEINPMFEVGYNAGSMPFIDHQQGTRTAYGANQLKHGVGYPTSMYQLRFDATLKVLHYPQRPLTTTETYKAARFIDMPTGTNAIVAILAGRSNIEDGIVVNKASVQRGMFMSTTFTTIDVMNATGDFDAPQVPDRQVYSKPRQTSHLGTAFRRVTAPVVVPGSFSHLTEEYPTQEQVERARRVEEETGVRVRLPPAHPAGIAPVGTQVQTGDVLITKVRRDAMGVVEFQQALNQPRSGYVDAVRMVAGANGTLGVRMRLAFPNMPEVGDKLASIESQKGLIAELRDPEDMPFASNGEIPDILMNPHGFPSRQTVSYILEAMYGRAVIAPSALSTNPVVGLQGAHRFNRVYRLEEMEDCFIRAGITLSRMNELNRAELDEAKRAFSQDPARRDRFLRVVVDAERMASFPLEYLPASQQQEVVRYVKDLLRKLLYTEGGERLYDRVKGVPLSRLETLKAVHSKRLVDLIVEVRGLQQGSVESVDDVPTEWLVDAEESVMEVLYAEREWVFYGELPKDAQGKFQVWVRRAIVDRAERGLEGAEGFVLREVDKGKVDRITLDELEAAADELEAAGGESGNVEGERGDVGRERGEALRLLVSEVRLTSVGRSLETDREEGSERVSRTQEDLDELFLEYTGTPGYVEEVSTTSGSVPKKVPLSFIRERDEALYRRLVGRYGRIYVQLADVIELKDRSLVSRQRLADLRAERAKMEDVKSRATQATAFNKQVEMDDVADYLKGLGWTDGGTELMRNGKTGEALQCRIFRGPVYYHAQTQMASEKIQARANVGAVSAVTRRPVAGKKAGGGGKAEEMQAFSTIAYGAPAVLHGRLTEESVMMRQVRCANCRMVCSEFKTDERVCGLCKVPGTLVEANLSFPTLRMQHLLMTMGINMGLAGDVVSKDVPKALTRRQRVLDEAVDEDFFEEREEEAASEEP